MRPNHLLCALTLACAPLPGLGDPLFVPEPVPHHIYDGGWEHFVGGGLAAFDCNGDALPDLYAAGGSAPAQLLRNTSRPGAALGFVADTPAPLALTGVIGAYPLDLDGDAWLDLAILRVGENHLMRGGPDCGFTPMDVPGFDGGAGWTTAFSATWEGSAPRPTLAFGNYVDRTNPQGPFGTCDTNRLFRPDGAGYAASRLTPGFCPLSMLFSDWSRTGRADLRISNDRHYYVTDGEEQLWRMDPQPTLMTASDGWAQFRLWGMGIAARDVDHDGRADVFLTSMGDQRMQMHIGGDRPTWRDVPFEQGTSAHRPYLGADGRPSTGWHVAFGDVQNDGRDDVIITKGNVEQMPDSAMADPNNLLVQRADGTFAEHGATAGIASLHRGRGAAFVDLNQDGLLDLAVVNRRAPLELWRNVTADAGNWLTLDLHQPPPNTRAIGAFVELDLGSHIVTRERMVGGGHAGGAALPDHFGLGTHQTVKLRVIWPDGHASDWLSVRANQHLKATRTDRALTLTPY